MLRGLQNREEFLTAFLWIRSYLPGLFIFLIYLASPILALIISGVSHSRGHLAFRVLPLRPDAKVTVHLGFTLLFAKVTVHFVFTLLFYSASLYVSNLTILF